MNMSAMLRRFLIGLGLAIVAGGCLAVLGAFGSFELGFGFRLMYWTGLLVAGYLLYLPFAIGSVLLARALDLPPIPMLLASALVATVPMTLLVWNANGLGMRWDQPSMMQFAELYPQVAIIGLFMTLLVWWRPAQAESGTVTGADDIAARASTAAAPDVSKVAEQEAVRPAIAARLPAGHGGVIHALETEDHYVRVHGETGSDLILMRMTDAIAEVEGVEGLRVHRGWWVARAAVARVSRDGRNMILTLENDLEIPVSRANQAAVKAAGWE